MCRLVLCCALALVAVIAAAEGEPLFTPEAKLEPADLRSMEIVDAAEGYRIRIDPEQVRSNPEALTFDLADGRRLEARRKRFREYGPSWRTWSGDVRLPGKGLERGPRAGYVFLTDHGDAVTGILNLGREQYQIRAEDGGQQLLKMAVRRGPVCGVEAGGVDLVPTAWLTDLPAPGGGDREARQVPGSATATTVRIDLLAVYPAVISSHTETVSVAKFVSLSVGLANDIFANSGIDAEYNLVATRRLNGASQPTEGTSLAVRRALDWLDDEHFVLSSEVVALRNAYNADMVALFIPQSWPDTVCGVANLPERRRSLPPTPENWLVRNQGGLYGTRAFSANRSWCGLNDFTLAHELGHNFGMRHQDEGTTHQSTVRDHLFAYGRGGNDMFGGMASVMGCELVSPPPPDPADPVCNRHPRFSNRPNLQRNNVAVANQQLPIFAGFFP